MQTLPRALPPELLAFCQSIAPGTPVFIDSRPEPDAEPGYCFNNAARKAARDGGAVAYGWAIWHLDGVYFEAEHHGIWRSHHGQLVDVSPQFGNPPTILFLPDAAAVYDQRNFRSNLMEPQSGIPLAVEFVDLAQTRNAIINRYRTGDKSAPDLNAEDQHEVDGITRRLQVLLEQLGY